MHCIMFKTRLVTYLKKYGSKVMPGRHSEKAAKKQSLGKIRRFGKYDAVSASVALFIVRLRIQSDSMYMFIHEWSSGIGTRYKVQGNYWSSCVDQATLENLLGWSAVESEAPLSLRQFFRCQHDVVSSKILRSHPQGRTGTLVQAQQNHWRLTWSST